MNKPADTARGLTADELTRLATEMRGAAQCMLEVCGALTKATHLMLDQAEAFELGAAMFKRPEGRV